MTFNERVTKLRMSFGISQRELGERIGLSHTTISRIEKNDTGEIRIEALKESGLRDRVKVIIGGAPITEEFARSVGADGYGANGFHAVRVVEALSAEGG